MKSSAEFVRFVSAGAIATTLHYAVLIVFVSALDSGPAIASMVGAFCGAAVNYWINHWYTFRSNRPHKEALPRFILIAGMGILLNGVIVKILTMAAVHYLPSQLGATLLILMFNFLLGKIWIFRQTR